MQVITYIPEDAKELFTAYQVVVKKVDDKLEFVGTDSKGKEMILRPSFSPEKNTVLNR